MVVGLTGVIKVMCGGGACTSAVTVMFRPAGCGGCGVDGCTAASLVVERCAVGPGPGTSVVWTAAWTS